MFFPFLLLVLHLLRLPVGRWASRWLLPSTLFSVPSHMLTAGPAPKTPRVPGELADATAWEVKALVPVFPFFFTLTYAPALKKKKKRDTVDLGRPDEDSLWMEFIELLQELRCNYRRITAAWNKQHFHFSLAHKSAPCPPDVALCSARLPGYFLQSDWNEENSTGGLIAIYLFINI